MTARIIHGESLEQMRALAAERVEVQAIVTDPPYGLSQEPDIAEVLRHWMAGDDYRHRSAGFMGKSWDSFVPGPSHWRAAFDLLPPGGHILCFAGTRTVDLMSIALRLAGFEIRDMLMWVYGCLDEKTKAVTVDGEKCHHEIAVGDLVLCYDPATNAYSYQPVQEVVAYEYSDTAYRLIGDFGEQIVSRNHRCIVERDGAEAFVFAEDAAREQQVRVPFLENLSDLRAALSDAKSFAGASEQNLRVRLCNSDDRCGEGGCGQASRAAQGQVVDSVCCMRVTDLAQHQVVDASAVSCLQSGVQRGFASERSDRQFPQGAQGLVSAERAGPISPHDGLREPFLARRLDVSEPQGGLRGSTDQICSLSGVFLGDGQKGRICDGTSFGCGAGYGASIAARRMRSSQKSPSDRQSAAQSHAFCDERGTQSIRAWGGHKTALVRIVPFHHVGKVWCVRVPTGAFVAVRDGIAFPTGNSGFPKSQDVGKAFDKSAGAVREVIGSKLDLPGYHPSGHDGGEAFGPCLSSSTPETRLRASEITAPVTAAARQWHGWGTALKPACEPIILARKPLAGTVAENVARFGTGAINVDGCRVEAGDGYSEYVVTQGVNTARTSYARASDHRKFAPSPAGRWPANLCHDGSEEVEAAFAEFGERPSGAPGIRRKDHQTNAMAGLLGKTGATEAGYADTGTASRFFYCAKATSDERGGSKHPTVKPLALMRWLVRLITPPRATVLDPFAGTGTTLAAAAMEGCNAIGIERERQYVLDIRNRLGKLTPSVPGSANA